MKKIIVLTASILLTVGTQAQKIVRPQPKPGPMPTVHISKPQEFELSNGLKVMIVEDHKLPRVSYQLTIDTPQIYEGNKAGVLSLTSDVLGNGTIKTPKEKFNEEVDFLGAGMDFSATGASASGLSKYADKLLQMMAEGALQPLFDQKEFDKAVEQTLENLKSKEKSVAAVKGRVKNALVYGKDHPYGEFSTEETIKNITLDDVKNTYKKYFVPGNAYLVVIGDVNFKHIKKEVTKLFGSWKKASIPDKKFKDPVDVQTTQIDFIDMPNAVQSEVSLVNIVNLKPSDKDYFAAMLANQILGGGGEGRLFMNLREAHGWTYGAYSSMGSGKYTSTFNSSASVRNVVTDSAVVEFMNELHRMTTKPVSKEELQLAKSKFIGEFVMITQKPGAIASFALRTKTQNLPADYYENYIKNIEAVTVDDVMRAAKKYIKPDNTRIVIVGKASDVAPMLDRLGYKVNYYDKFANPIEKATTSKPIPAGVTPQTVFDNYLKAIGGEKKLKNVKTLKMVTEGTLQGMPLKGITLQTNKDQFKMVVEMMGMELMKQIITPTKVAIFAQGQEQALTDEEQKELRLSLDGQLLAQLKGLKEGTELVGIEKFNGEDCYVLKTKSKMKGQEIEGVSYYSVNSALLLGTEINSPVGKQVSNLTDYKEVEGIKFPHKTIVDMGGQEVEMKATSIEINKGVTDADFE